MLRVWTNLMPRRSSRNTWTAALVGAGVGIALWEWMRRSGEKNVDRDGGELNRLADQVLHAVASDGDGPVNAGEP
ncbi:MAG: hypothetical protein QJR01_04835 [Kyrpidia sp.]|nr:hypothetical protein [Kyrpidia sp.]